MDLINLIFARGGVCRRGVKDKMWKGGFNKNLEGGYAGEG